MRGLDVKNYYWNTNISQEQRQPVQ